MEVIGFQLIIIVTISITFLMMGRKPALYLSIFWTLWTVVLLFYPPLIITQLLFTWSTYLICRNIADSKRKIRELRDIASEYTKLTQKRIEDAANNSQVQTISGDEHLTELHAAINSAKKEIIILSGWVASGVIDHTFSELIEKKINEGVRFYLGYGWENSRGEHRTSSYVEEAVARLDNIKSKYPENLIIGKYPNHEKILIKDTDYVICGSNNWLSNRSFRNSERSLKIFSNSLAVSESERIKKDIQQAATPLAVPGQVRSLEVPKQGAGWLMLDWKAPADGGAVNAYKVMRRERPAGAWEETATAVITEATLVEQPTGKELEYHIVAVNKAGDGEPSDTEMVVL